METVEHLIGGAGPTGHDRLSHWPAVRGPMADWFLAG
jgi:hypothetical protein